MRVLIACDKFKGSLTAPEACEAIREGLKASSCGDSFEISILPIADGGDGMARTLTAALAGEWKVRRVRNALGDPLEAGYGLIENGKTAVIEMAEASGIAQLRPETLNPAIANTFGTGELIAEAIARGVRKIILGIGGSATNDGGTGMAKALGWKFLDGEGTELNVLPSDLVRLAKVIPPERRSLPEVIVACDVTNPLLGPNGSTRIYGPQKGISPEAMKSHEQGLATLVSILEAENEACEAGAGAAGGLGFGALAFLGASLTPGFALVASLLKLEDAIGDADLVITGEGKLDLQSLEGKAPFGVATLAQQHGKCLVSFCGIREGSHLEEHFGEILEIRNRNLSIQENLENGFLHLKEASLEWAESLP